MTQAIDSVRISRDWETTAPADRPLAVVGSLPPRAMAALRSAAESLNVGIAHAGRNGDPNAVLDRETPMAVIAAIESSAFGRACALVRRRRALARVPVIGACDHRSELSFAELFHAGGDDLVNVDDPSALVRRIRALRNVKPSRPSTAERAVVVGGDELSLYARALSNAGIDPVVASSADEAIALSTNARFVIASDELDSAGAVAALTQARKAGSTTPWVLVAAPKRVVAVRSAAKELASVGVLDAYAPAENALFMANELCRPAGANARQSARLLFGTSVIFRHAGREEGDDVGFTYNISANGIFVRTLAPLSPGDDVWLEVWPPRSARRVRLAGRVVWQRAFGPDDHATVPAGFALRIEGGLPGDVERWTDGCAALQREQMAT